MHDGVLPSVASTHGYVMAWRIGAVMLVIGGILVLALLERVLAMPRSPEAELIAQPVTPVPTPAT
jgi:hypothetical protein